MLTKRSHVLPLPEGEGGVRGKGLRYRLGLPFSSVGSGLNSTENSEELDLSSKLALGILPLLETIKASGAVGHCTGIDEGQIRHDRANRQVQSNDFVRSLELEYAARPIPLDR